MLALPSCSSGRRTRNPHKRRRSNLVWQGGRLRDVVASTHVVQQQIREQRNRLAGKQRMRVRRGLQDGDVARPTSDRVEHLLAVPRWLTDRASRRRRQELHERLEVVDRGQPRPDIGEVLGIGYGIAELHLRRGHPGCRLVREQFVGDAHLVPIRVSAEGAQCRVLRFPAKPADPHPAGADVDDARGAAADAVGVAIVGIFERQQRLIADGFHESSAEYGNRHPARDDVGFGRHHRLTGVRRRREQVEERVELRAIRSRQLVDSGRTHPGTPRALPTRGSFRQSPARCGRPRSSWR